jgi:hypothetical protein
VQNLVWRDGQLTTDQLAIIDGYRELWRRLEFKPGRGPALRPPWVAFPPVAPEVTSLSPSQGRPGTTVAIAGQGLGSTRTVDFSGTPGHLVSVSPTEVMAVVPDSLKTPTSRVVVTVTDHSGCPVQVPAGSFNLTRPCEGRIEPGQGAWGDRVRIVGQGLTASVEVIFYDYVPATVTNIGDGDVWVVVPEGAITGPVTVRAYDCSRQVVCEFKTADFSVAPVVECLPVAAGAAALKGSSAHSEHQQGPPSKAQPQQSSTPTKKPQPPDKST